MRVRSRQCALAIRAQYERRLESVPRDRFHFVTLTQPKLSERVETVEGAVLRLQRTWAAFRRSHWFQEHVQGGMKAVEIPFSNYNGVGGWHAHLHLAIELDADTPIDDFVRRWMRHVVRQSGYVDIEAQKARALDDRRVGQLAKYVTKPFELEPHHAVRFFAAMCRRRLLDGFGTWREWRQAAKRPSCEGWLVGPSLGQLRDVAREDGWVEFASPVRDRGTMREHLLDAGGEWAGIAELLPEDPLFYRGTLWVPTAALRARDILRSLRTDPRPCWLRSGETVQLVDKYGALPPSPDCSGGVGTSGPFFEVRRPLQERRENAGPREFVPLLGCDVPRPFMTTLYEAMMGKRWLLGERLLADKQ